MLGNLLVLGSLLLGLLLEFLLHLSDLVGVVPLGLLEILVLLIGETVVLAGLFLAGCELLLLGIKLFLNLLGKALILIKLFGESSLLRVKFLQKTALFSTEVLIKLCFLLHKCTSQL